jgi:polyketide biosynthesis enoyl-CoA hydratase PksI
MTAAEVWFGPVALRMDPPLAMIGMEYHEGRNRVVTSLMDGLVAALAEAGANDDVRVVVLQGLPDVFCAGAAAEDLLRDDGGATRGVGPLTRAIAECPIPVVASVQGHALGGGLLLALYADIAVFSEKSRYAANFMAYGFTPYGGATYLVPAKLGTALGTEMLLTGRSFSGRELAGRGAGVVIVAHPQVPVVARRLALRTAQAPRKALRVLKNRLATELLSQVDAAMDQERAGHVETLADPEVRKRIDLLYPGRT